MQCNRLLVEIGFKSDLNRLLIDFYDPIPAVQSTCHNDLIRIQIQILDPNWIYIGNWLNLIEIGQK